MGDAAMTRPLTGAPPHPPPGPRSAACVCVRACVIFHQLKPWNTKLEPANTAKQGCAADATAGASSWVVGRYARSPLN
jgi:hypothetical protein